MSNKAKQWWPTTLYKPEPVSRIVTGHVLFNDVIVGEASFSLDDTLPFVFSGYTSNEPIKLSLRLQCDEWKGLETADWFYANNNDGVEYDPVTGTVEASIENLDWSFDLNITKRNNLVQHSGTVIAQVNFSY